MKKLLFIVVGCLVYMSAMAQIHNLPKVKIDTLYYDKQWKVSQSPLFADFYRLTMQDPSSPQSGYKVRDYYITGELQGEGACTYIGKNDDQETIWDGKVVTYFKNGKLSTECIYENGVLNGEAVTYYESGLIKTKIPFSRGLINGTAFIFSNDGSACKKIEYVNDRFKYDYYELTDYNGCYSKFYHANDKIKWVSPETSERQKIYRNGTVISYYENNGLITAVSMDLVRDYGLYLKFNVLISNNSLEPTEVKIENISASFKYEDDAKTKQKEIDLRIISAYEYDKKIKRKQNTAKALVGLANGLAAAQAGYSVSSTHINSGYASASASVGGAAAVGSGGWAVGVNAGIGASVGASSTNINTASYDGFAAYQANMIANAQFQNMSNEMLEERIQKIDAYLKEDTLFPGNDVNGYFLIPKKIKNIKYGGDLKINFNINGADYLFEYSIHSQKELKNIMTELYNKILKREISFKEADEEYREQCSFIAK